MRNFVQSHFIKTPLIVIASALATSMPALADDTEVFEAVLNSQNKPNILFVLDYSGSMEHDVGDNPIASSDTTTESKIEILKSAVNTLLLDNAGKVNVGIGSTYNWRTSGVRWPVSDLEANANTIDPSIPVGDDVSVAEVISSQLARRGPEHSTATVNGLAEAAAYFRGDDVLHTDYNVNEPWYHMPDRWDAADRKYSGGNHYAAMPSSYTPADAYKFGVENSGFGYCTDYVDGNQGCAAKTTFDCVDHDAYSGTSAPTAAGPDGGGSAGGDWSVPARTDCKYVHPDSWTTPKYVSPIQQQCQANFIVLISDGQPTNIRNTNTLNTVLGAAGLTSGYKIDECEDLSLTIFKDSAENGAAGNCGPEILEYLATNDINPSIEKTKVKTFTVGFAVDGPGKEYLELLASSGEGEFYEATKPAELTTALNNVIASILAGSQNFAELSIDVDPTSYSHDNRTYFSLFSPNQNPSWKGNLKGFFVDETGLIDINGNAATFDDGKGIKFVDESHSFWSANADGNDISMGGASESITMPAVPNSRNLYTYLGGAGKELALSVEAMLNSGNDDITLDLMGNPSDALRTEALDWLQTAPMGDPLHTKPIVVKYGTKDVVYIMTNQGLLHAFDATKPIEPGMTPADVSGGEELFAFMPKELLANVTDIYTNDSNMPGHIYGLDGAITRWHDDANRDGVVNGVDTVTLIFGMRRGGSAYYALDVTNPDQPEFLWQVDQNKPKFERLAQTWSRASLITVNRGGTSERVVMFGGGYEADVVDGTNSPTESLGNAVFMVDKLGQWVWSIDETTDLDLKYAIPTDLTVLDTDYNGDVDRAYFGDVGGQMWRVDFDDVSTMADTTLTKFADVYDGTNHRPIFYPPSVSINKEQGKRYFAVSFGTGDRTQPMQEGTQNAFYMLKDRDIKAGAPTSSTTISATTCVGLPTAVSSPCIYDATENDIGSSDENTRNTAKQMLQAAKGWVVNLVPGEKSLSQVVTFEGKFLATTFEPEEALDENGDVEACSFAMIGRLYIMSVEDARPIEILSDGSESQYGLTKANRVTFLHGTTIPSKPVVMLPADSINAQIFVDKESIVAVQKQIDTVFWHAK